MLKKKHGSRIRFTLLDDPRKLGKRKRRVKKKGNQGVKLLSRHTKSQKRTVVVIYSMHVLKTCKYLRPQIF